jgi:hypothetical protein
MTQQKSTGRKPGSTGKTKEYLRVLKAAKDERPLQEIFVKYPYILLRQFNGAWNYYTIIPQFGLAGQYIPDFLIISGDSGCWHLYFIELESPKAKVFNKDGKPSRQLATAQRQITDWAMWLSANKDFLIQRLSELLPAWMAKTGGTTPSLLDKRQHIDVGYHIVIGRRMEMSEQDKMRRAYWSPTPYSTGTIVSYDRFLHWFELADKVGSDEKLIKERTIPKRKIDRIRLSYGSA